MKFNDRKMFKEDINVDNQVLTNSNESSTRVELFEKVFENISWRDVTKRRDIHHEPEYRLDLSCDPVSKESLSRPYVALNKREKHRLEIKERLLTKEFQKQMQMSSLERRKVRQRLAELEQSISCHKQCHQQNLKESPMVNAKLFRSGIAPPDKGDVYQLNKFISRGNSNCSKPVEYSLKAATHSPSTESVSHSCRRSRAWITVKPQPSNTLHKGLSTTAPSVNAYSGDVNGTRQEKMACNITPIVKCDKETNGLTSETGIFNQASITLEKLSLSDNMPVNSVDCQQRLKVSIPFIDETEDDALNGEMRPRARTIPSTERRTQPLSLPEIKIEDFSEKLNIVDHDNSDNGSFQIFASTPRRRAFTCPDDMFRRRKNVRPPTPPPYVPNSASSKGKTKFTFQRKKLFKVAEDRSEPPQPIVSKSPCDKLLSKNNFSTNDGMIESVDNKREIAPRQSNGYLFTGSRKYISRSSCGIKTLGGKDSIVSMHRAHSIADGELPGVRAWRTRGSELTS